MSDLSMTSRSIGLPVLALWLASSLYAVPPPPRDVQEFMGLAAGIEKYRARNGKLPDEENWFEPIRQDIHPDLLATNLDATRFQYRVIENGGQLTYSLVCCGRDGKFGTRDDIDAAYVDRLMRSIREAGRVMAAAGMNQRASPRTRRKQWYLLLLPAAAVIAAGAFALKRRRALGQHSEAAQQHNAR